MPVFFSSHSDNVEPILGWILGRSQPTPEQYLRGMTGLELLWQQSVPGLSFQVVHEEPGRLPGTSTRNAMAVFAAVTQKPSLQKWFVRNIRNAVVHSAPNVDAMAVVGDCIHFYQAK